MIRDVWTVVWREWKEHSLLDGGWVSASSLLAFVGLVGVLVPWQVGIPWIRAPWTLVFWAWMPLFLVTVLTADSVAGERERHTLETLLATRLPSRALLFGKVAAAVVWVWAALLVCLPIGLAVVNLAHVQGPPVLYSPGAALGIAGLAMLSGILGAALAVLVSMRAATVRQAQQILCVCVLVLFLVPLLALRLLPVGWVGGLLSFFATSSQERVALVGGAVFLAVDAALLAVAGARFRRRRLMAE